MGPPAFSTVPQRMGSALGLGALALVLVLYGPPGPPAASGAPVPEPPAPPIGDATEAVRLSVALFPPGRAIAGTAARLISRRTFELWAISPGGVAVANPVADEFDWSLADPDSGVWLVGLLGQALTARDVLAVGAPAGVLLTDERLVEGGFYAWDANSAELLAQGALLPGSGQTMSSLRALANAPITPRPATPWPTYALATPGPTETWSPAEMATAVAQLTAQPRMNP
jgi:hypothetical protein